MKAIVARDAEIQLRVLQELKWDTRVEETDIGVVRHAPGIREVIDRLRIDPYYK